MIKTRLAVLFCFILFATPALAQEDPNTGQIPDPSSYQGSMELQRQSDQQDQQLREQLNQQSQQQQSSWNQAHDSQTVSARPESSEADATANSQRSRDYPSAPTPPANPLAAAFQRGDYVTVLKILRPKAMAGNASAQHNLGFMYEKGYGVARNPAMAASWYRKAADQGNPLGQLALGRLYYEGAGLQRDLVEAYKWVYLAGRGTSRAFPYLQLIENLISYQQMTQAIREGQQWAPVGRH